jgi:VCBS repeat-containing protein
MSSRVRRCVSSGVGVVGLVGVLAAPALAGPQSFGLASSYDNGGDSSTAVAIGDLNGDGKPDLVSAIRSEGISVLLGSGGGSFGSAVKYAAPASSFGLYQLSVALRDLNADGVLDVVGQAARDNAALVWLGVPTSPGSGVGTGTFAAGSKVLLNASPTCGNSSGNPCQAEFPADVAVADFNNDAKPDVATSNTSTNNIAILLGNGDGTFDAPTYVTLNSASGPQQISAGLVDGGSNVDLVVADLLTDNVSVLLGNGSGGFGTATNVAAGITRPSKLTLADVDGDSDRDIVTANTGFDGEAAVLLNNGSGNFGSPSVIAAGTQPSSVAVGDLNGDAKVDLTVGNAGSDEVLTLLGDGAGGLSSPLSFGLNGAGGPSQATVGDLDGDGRADIATANDSFGAGDPNDVSVLLNTSNRAPFAVADSYSHNGSDTALTVAATGVLGNDTDADANALTAVQVSAPTHGTLTLNSDGSFTYQATAGYVGSDSFTYKANDGTDDSNVATVTITTTAGCNGLAATIAGNGTISGTPGNDVIVTGGGADVISGGNGNDTICSYGGGDVISGGNQNDYINGGDGNDVIDGGNDNDSVRGGGGNDTLSGGNGDDSVLGQDGDDTLSGGNNTDTVVGGAGSDSLTGNGGTGDVCAGDNNGGAPLAGTDSTPGSHGCETIVEVP